MRKIGVCLRRCPRGYFTREFHHAPGQFRCIGKFFVYSECSDMLNFHYDICNLKHIDTFYTHIYMFMAMMDEHS